MNSTGKEQGQGLVSYALVLILVLIIIFGLLWWILNSFLEAGLVMIGIFLLFWIIGRLATWLHQVRERNR